MGFIMAFFTLYNDNPLYSIFFWLPSSWIRKWTHEKKNSNILLKHPLEIQGWREAAGKSFQKHPLYPSPSKKKKALEGYAPSRT